MKIKAFTSLLFFIALGTYGQKPFSEKFTKPKMESMPGIQVICPTSHVDVNTYRGYSDEVKKALEIKKKARTANVSNFVVEYDPNMPEQAKDAFQRAVDIWDVLLDTPVKINVLALWSELEPGVLGSAGPATYYRDFEGAPQPYTYYPVALAEKLSGKDLNAAGDYDIIANFSSGRDWYYGSTGTPAVGQHDFTSVVLHELCHGLGFVGSIGVQGTQGYYGFSSYSLPAIFDTKIVNERGLQLTDTLNFANPSNALRNQLISENLFFNTPQAIAANGGRSVRLYAPTQFNSGSSIYHLDDKSFPAGSENALMRWASGVREVNYDPGPVTIQIMNEMGWRATRIIHKPLKDYASASSVPVAARILSDAGVVSNTVTLNYFTIDLSTDITNAQFNQAFESGMTNPTKVQMNRTANADEFSGMLNLSTAGSRAFVAYFITVNDVDGKSAVSPATMPNVPHYFYLGWPDQWGPAMYHVPYQIIGSGRNLPVIVDVDDDYEAGIASVYVEYEINGVAQKAIDLKKLDPVADAAYSQGQLDATTFISKEGFPALSDNDQVTYRIKARDASGNITVIPTVAGGPRIDDPVVEDTYEFVATSALDEVNQYFNNFDTQDEDFALIGFDINQVTGLSSPSLHTRSPYKNGLGLYNPIAPDQVYMPFENEAIAMLRKPVVLKSSGATIAWDEIVLVEPGEDGSAYGDQNFWDYVVVEISPDYGLNWYEIMEGYDSRKENAWKELYTSTLSPALTGSVINPTSNGVPTQALYRTREVNLNQAFPNASLGGLAVLVRFRLHADQWANGWGWAIDNLAIQADKPAPLASEDALFDLKVSPNPSSDYIDLKAIFKAAKTAKVELVNTLGVAVLRENLEISENTLNHRMDIRTQSPGSYIISVDTESGRQTRHIVITK
jgi:hypothetical protein